MRKFLSIAIFFLCLLLVVSPVLADETKGVEDSPREQAQRLVDQGLALGDNSLEEAECYRRAIGIDPTYASAYFNLGFVYHSTGELEKAIEEYRQCLRYDPKRYDAHRNLAVCLLAVRRDAALYEVRSHLNMAIELEEYLPPGNRPSTLGKQRAELLDLERRINKVLEPYVRESYSSDEIIEILSRRVTRGGQGLYEGPRLPILFFSTGSAKLTTKDEPQLRALSRALNSPGLVASRFTIEGHADGRGQASSNLNLSRRRAKAVRDWLVQHGGVDPKRIIVEFYGEDHPIYPNDSPVHFRYNRRIEIVKRYKE
ncbi:MAG: OmpA family protein [Deltaproteobacteria bacterium]|uniref:OmpA family protein n=1 Tax=Candidatus Desulfacyla euxinica TaxID=2841693 RepID=A0A8J6TA59_9DELT|nr:OmpA family protein [Candidatus Desulfacyla euxinica]